MVGACEDFDIVGKCGAGEDIDQSNGHVGFNKCAKWHKTLDLAIFRVKV